MGEAFLRREAALRGLADVEVSSVGTWGQDGSPATREAVAALRGKGIDLSGHTARTLDAQELRAADLVLVMTSVHAREVEDLDPSAGDKVRFLKELTELRPVLDEGDPPEVRLRRLLEATRPAWRRELDLDDPYGLPLGVYQRTAEEIERQIACLAEVLFGPHPSVDKPGTSGLLH